MKRTAIWFYHLFTLMFDPLRAVRGLSAYFRYVGDWLRYVRLPGAEPLSAADAYPQLHDRTGSIEGDAHYVYTNGWAMRRIVAQLPAQHVDIGSQTMFVNMLSAVLPSAPFSKIRGASSKNCAFQRFSTWALTWYSRQASAAVLAPVNTSNTTWALDSGVNLRRFVMVVPLSRICYPELSMLSSFRGSLHWYQPRSETPINSG